MLKLGIYKLIFFTEKNLIYPKQSLLDYKLEYPCYNTPYLKNILIHYTF